MTSLRKAFRFFLEHAGYRVGQHAQDALACARAERDAETIGVEFVWKYDDDADYSWLEGRDEKGRYLFSKHERERHHEVEWCRAVLPCPEHGVDCKHATTLAALSGIFDADANYRRVIQAELALEAHDLIAQVLKTSRMDLLEAYPHLGKYEGELNLAERLDEMDGEGMSDANLGESESFGYFTLFTGLTTESVGGPIGPTVAAILCTNSQGFVSADYFESDADARARWAELEAEYETFNNEGDTGEML